MNVVLSAKAAKTLERINEPLKGRIIAALHKLKQDPPKGDIRPLTGRSGYRLRIGGWRVLFGIKSETIVVTEIAPRGQAY